MTQGPTADGPVALEWPGDVRDLAAGLGAWWLLALVAAALAVGAVAFAARRRRPPAAVASPAPALVPAPTAAALLRALALPRDVAEAAAFVAEIKRLVRLHARERFGVAAFAATSEELQRALPQAPGLAPCLRACDAVLFAAGAMRGDAATALHADALAFAAGGVESAP